MVGGLDGWIAPNGRMTEFRMLIWLYGCIVRVLVGWILDCKIAICFDGHMV